jgi:hypothetical protein
MQVERQGWVRHGKEGGQAAGDMMAKKTEPPTRKKNTFFRNDIETIFGLKKGKELLKG